MRKVHIERAPQGKKGEKPCSYRFFVCPCFHGFFFKTPILQHKPLQGLNCFLWLTDWVKVLNHECYQNLQRSINKETIISPFLSVCTCTRNLNAICKRYKKQYILFFFLRSTICDLMKAAKVCCKILTPASLTLQTYMCPTLTRKAIRAAKVEGCILHGILQKTPAVIDRATPPPPPLPPYTLSFHLHHNSPDLKPLVVKPTWPRCGRHNRALTYPAGQPGMRKSTVWPSFIHLGVPDNIGGRLGRGLV